MRFSSAIVLTVAAAALISSISAKSLDDNAGICHRFCVLNENCVGCSFIASCVSIGSFSGSNDMTHLHDSSSLSACESRFCFHIGAVWPLALTRELVFSEL
jgi:hypothetical protein